MSHARAGRVDWRVVAWMAPPSIVGAVAGALVADDVPESLLYAAIAAVLVWSGVDLALRPVRAVAREHLRLWPAAAGGLGIGALGGAVGVILGTLRMPTLAAPRRHGREAGRGNQPRRRLSPRPGRVRDARWRKRRRLGHPRSPAWPVRYLAAGSAPERRGGSTRTCFGSCSGQSWSSSARSSPRRPSSSAKRSWRSPWRAESTSSCAGVLSQHRRGARGRGRPAESRWRSRGSRGRPCAGR